MGVPYFRHEWRFGFSTTAGASAASTGTPRTSTNVSSTEYAQGHGRVRSISWYVQSDANSSSTFQIKTTPPGSTSLSGAHAISTQSVGTGSVVYGQLSSGAYFDVWPHLLTHSSGVVTVTILGHE